MTFDIEPLLISKKTFRKKLLSLPLQAKLAMLDLLRERAITIHNATEHLPASLVQEKQPPYGKK